MTSEPTNESVIEMARGHYHSAIVAADCMADVRKNQLGKVRQNTEE